MPTSKRRKPKHQGPTKRSKIVIFDMPTRHGCGCDGTTRDIMYSDGVTEEQVTHADPCNWKRVNPARKPA
jgi:hypothetical protein